MALTFPSRAAHPIKVSYLRAALLVLVVAASAAVAWQLGGKSGDGATTIVREAGTVGPVEPSVTWYIVASQAQADFVLQGEEDAARVRWAAGEESEAPGVIRVVIADDLQTDPVVRSVIDANALRVADGLSEITLIDLRAGPR